MDPCLSYISIDRLCEIFAFEQWRYCRSLALSSGKVFNCVVATIRRRYDNISIPQNTHWGWRTNKADCFASATTDCSSRKTSSKCCWCRFIKILSMTEIVMTTDNQISHVFKGKPGIIEGFCSSFNVFTRSAPQWKVFVMTHNQFRFPKWRCKQVWAMTANKWTFSVCFPFSVSRVCSLFILRSSWDIKILHWTFLCSCGRAGSSMFKEILEQW